MIPQDENSYRKGFSVLLRRLRREEQGWKQKELAAKAGLKLRTIQDLETAQKAILDHDTVSKLAVAFGLGGAAQEEFFRAAGLSILNLSDDEVQWNIFIYEFHKSIQFPAFVSDDLANIQSLNSYIIELLQMDMEAFTDLSCRFGRFNIMHFFLDPIFNAKKLYGGQWSYYTILNAWFLRNLSRPYVHSERYQKLLADLYQLEGFQEVWAAAEQLETPLPPYLGIVHHQRYGTVNFWHSMSAKPNMRSEQMSFLFYHPADADSERAFAQIRENVPKAAYQVSNTKGRGLVRLF